MSENITTTMKQYTPESSRRDFLKFCSAVAAVIGVELITGSQIAAAFLSSTRPPVIWLHFSECTGCTEAALRITNPGFDELILNLVSLEYHETLMATAGRTPLYWLFGTEFLGYKFSILF